MSEIPSRFRAFRIHNDERGYRSGIDEIRLDDLTPGQVTVRVDWSSINYKDALAATGKGRIVKQYPLTGGIDVAGTVIHSQDERFEAGQEVVATGCQLSEAYDGGYTEYLRLRSESVVPLPTNLSTREAMALGTAGFTAALCLYRMEANGQTPEKGPIVVTGATGGVGSIAIDLLTRAWVRLSLKDACRLQKSTSENTADVKYLTATQKAVGEVVCYRSEVYIRNVHAVEGEQPTITNL